MLAQRIKGFVRPFIDCLRVFSSLLIFIYRKKQITIIKESSIAGMNSNEDGKITKS